MQETTSKTDPAYQRLSWDALRKSINGLVNKANAQNIRPIIKELLSEVSIILIALFSEASAPHVSSQAFKRLCRVRACSLTSVAWKYISSTQQLNSSMCVFRHADKEPQAVHSNMCFISTNAELYYNNLCVNCVMFSNQVELSQQIIKVYLYHKYYIFVSLYTAPARCAMHLIWDTPITDAVHMYVLFLATCVLTTWIHATWKWWDFLIPVFLGRALKAPGVAFI